MKYRSTYERLTSDPERRRKIEEEGFIIETTEDIIGLMEEKGVSRVELAERLGTSRAFISQVLNGSRNMTLRTLFRISRALGHDSQIAFNTIDARKKQKEPALARR